MLSVQEAQALGALQAQFPDADAALLTRCLMARKFGVKRSAALYKAYKTKLVPQIGDQKILASEVREQLMTGELMLPGTRDKDGAAIIIYDAAKHRANKFTAQQSLRAVLYLMDRALCDDTTMRAGVTIVALLNGLAWNQLDNTMHKLLLRTLQDHYPARVHQVCVVSPSWVTNAVLKLCRPFMKARLAAKIRAFTNVAGLTDAVDLAELPVTAGGTFPYNHNAWLQNFVPDGDCIQALSPSFSERRLALVMSPPPSTGVSRRFEGKPPVFDASFEDEDIPEQVLAEIEAAVAEVEADTQAAIDKMEAEAATTTEIVSGLDELVVEKPAGAVAIVDTACTVAETIVDATADVATETEAMPAEGIEDKPVQATTAVVASEEVPAMVESTEETVTAPVEEETTENENTTAPPTAENITKQTQTTAQKRRARRKRSKLNKRIAQVGVLPLAAHN